MWRAPNDQVRTLKLPPLRPYQERGYRELQTAAAQIIAERRAHLCWRNDAAPGVGLLAQAPTGAGKTMLALHIAAGAVGRGSRVLWLAHRAELIDQPVGKLREYGADVRVIKADADEGSPDAPITVASIQTLIARDQRPEADVVIYDEARHYVAAEWGRIAQHYRSAVRIGLDATPARADGAPLGDLFERLISISSIAELTELGFLVPSRIIAPASYDRALADSPVDGWLAHADGKRTIVFCASVAHADDTAKAFRDAGVSAESVDASTAADKRRAALERVRSGETTVLCNCMLFTEGLDLVELECIVVARGVGHESMWLQIGGRALRPSPHTGKTHATIVDLNGNVHRHGWLDDARTWHLDGKPVRRQEGLPVAVMCATCLSWHRGGGRPCPHCGAALPMPKEPRIKARDLQEQRRGEPIERKQRRLVHFVRLALERGHSPWSAAHRFKGTYGRKPSRGQMAQAIAEAYRIEHARWRMDHYWPRGQA